MVYLFFHWHPEKEDGNRDEEGMMMEGRGKDVTAYIYMYSRVVGSVPITLQTGGNPGGAGGSGPTAQHGHMLLRLELLTGSCRHGARWRTMVSAIT